MWPNPEETADLVTFTEEIVNGKLHFLCSVLKKNAEKHRLQYYLFGKHTLNMPIFASHWNYAVIYRKKINKNNFRHFFSYWN